MPTMNERLGDELDELRNKISKIQEDLHEREKSGAQPAHEGKKELRDRNIIIRNFPERDNEDVKYRVKNLIRDSLKLKDVSVLSAERMVNRNNPKPGLVKATLDSTASKQEVMRQKNILKDCVGTVMCLLRTMYRLPSEQ